MPSTPCAAQDIAIDYKRTIKQGELKIKQRIPNKQFFLVPSPEIKVRAVHCISWHSIQAREGRWRRRSRLG